MAKSVWGQCNGCAGLSISPLKGGDFLCGMDLEFLGGISGTARWKHAFLSVKVGQGNRNFMTACARQDDRRDARTCF